MPEWKVIHGDSLEVLKGMDDESVDALVTDPPAGISFMGKEWDSDKGSRGKWIAWLTDIMKEAIRVLKPGAHGFVWALPRTSHWTAMALEDAGFEIRDCVYHMFGSGFPKSRDMSKAIDTEAGMQREVIGQRKEAGMSRTNKKLQEAGYRPNTYTQDSEQIDITKPATPEAEQWQGWGTALKPAVECWWLVRKPIKTTIAQNVLEHGTGAINIDGCRIGTAEGDDSRRVRHNRKTIGGNGKYQGGVAADTGGAQGRWPANVILTHHPECECLGTKRIKAIGGGTEGKTKNFKLSEGSSDRSKSANVGGLGDKDGFETVEDWKCHPDCPVGMFPETESGKPGVRRKPHSGASRIGQLKNARINSVLETGYGDTGSAARFFYCAKASKEERGENNRHPTVKPVALMRYLCRLITPLKGTVLDPFCGSGTTGIAALAENFSFVGIDSDEESVKTSRKRLKNGWFYLEDDESKKAGEKLEDDVPKKGQIKLF